jgi:hypothetical protein
LSLSDVASVTSIVAAVIALIGLLLVWLQLRKDTAAAEAAVLAARAQATIQFQARFKESRDARGYVVQNFPVHESVPVEWQHVGATSVQLSSQEAQLRRWEHLDELSDSDRHHANAVIHAVNDVAQYVADGMELRSALQQYHLVFLRVGVLLNPYISLINEPQSDGVKRPRWGRRVPLLFNAALAYHKCHPKHRDRSVAIARDVPVSDYQQSNVSVPAWRMLRTLGDRIPLLQSRSSVTGDVNTPSERFELRFLGPNHELSQFACFADDQDDMTLPDSDLETVIRASEERLRQ